MRFPDLIARGTRAAQPAATAVSEGALYYVTDENKLERGNGATWDAFSGAAGGAVVQVKNVQSGAVGSGSTILPFDDTIPQQTEGDEYLTLAITPTDAANLLIVDVVIFASVTATPWIIAALFKDAGADAVAVAAAFNNLSTAGMTISFRHVMVAGGVAATTFKVRVGPSSAATVTVNGQSGGRIFGGVAASSLTITEVTP
jgi:hypothetical protein